MIKEYIIKAMASSSFHAASSMAIGLKGYGRTLGEMTC